MRTTNERKGKLRRREFACRFLQEFHGPGLAVPLQIGIGEHGSLANEDDRVPEHPLAYLQVHPEWIVPLICGSFSEKYGVSSPNRILLWSTLHICRIADRDVDEVGMDLMKAMKT